MSIVRVREKFVSWDIVKSATTNIVPAKVGFVEVIIINAMMIILVSHHYVDIVLKTGLVHKESAYRIYQNRLLDAKAEKIARNVIKFVCTATAGTNVRSSINAIVKTQKTVLMARIV